MCLKDNDENSRMHKGNVGSCMGNFMTHLQQEMCPGTCAIIFSEHIDCTLVHKKFQSKLNDMFVDPETKSLEFEPPSP